MNNTSSMHSMPGLTLSVCSIPVPQVKQDNTGSTNFLDGRIIKLDVECRPKDGVKTPVDKSCLLFKITGSVNCKWNVGPDSPIVYLGNTTSDSTKYFPDTCVSSQCISVKST